MKRAKFILTLQAAFLMGIFVFSGAIVHNSVDGPGPGATTTLEAQLGFQVDADPAAYQRLTGKMGLLAATLEALRDGNPLPEGVEVAEVGTVDGQKAYVPTIEGLDTQDLGLVLLPTVRITELENVEGTLQGQLALGKFPKASSAGEEVIRAISGQSRIINVVIPGGRVGFSVALEGALDNVMQDRGSWISTDIGLVMAEIADRSEAEQLPVVSDKRGLSGMMFDRLAGDGTFFIQPSVVKIANASVGEAYVALGRPDYERDALVAFLFTKDGSGNVTVTPITSMTGDQVEAIERLSLNRHAAIRNQVSLQGDLTAWDIYKAQQLAKAVSAGEVVTMGDLTLTLALPGATEELRRQNPAVRDTLTQLERALRIVATGSRLDALAEFNSLQRPGERQAGPVPSLTKISDGENAYILLVRPKPGEDTLVPLLVRDTGLFSCDLITNMTRADVDKIIVLSRNDGHRIRNQVPLKDLASGWDGFSRQLSPAIRPAPVSSAGMQPIRISGVRAYLDAQGLRDVMDTSPSLVNEMHGLFEILRPGLTAADLNARLLETNRHVRPTFIGTEEGAMLGILDIQEAAGVPIVVIVEDAGLLVGATPSDIAKLVAAAKLGEGQEAVSDAWVRFAAQLGKTAAGSASASAGTLFSIEPSQIKQVGPQGDIATIDTADAWGVGIIGKLEALRLAGVDLQGAPAIADARTRIEALIKKLKAPPAAIGNIRDDTELLQPISGTQEALLAPVSADEVIAIEQPVGTYKPVHAKQALSQALKKLSPERGAVLIDFNALGTRVEKDGRAVFVPNDFVIKALAMLNTLKEEYKVDGKPRYHFAVYSDSLSGEDMQNLLGALASGFQGFVQAATVAEAVDSIVQQENIRPERITITLAESTVRNNPGILGALQEAINLAWVKTPAQGSHVSYKAAILRSIGLLDATGLVPSRVITELKELVQDAPEIRGTVVEPETDDDAAVSRMQAAVSV